MCAQRDKKPGFDSELDGQILKVKLRGEIDHHSAGAVRCNLDEMIKSARPTRLLIDMSAVDFMDSSGLGLIMGRYSLMESIGGETCVLDPSPATEKILSLAGMERVVKILRSSVKDDTVAKRSQSREIKRRSACHRRSAAISKRESATSREETKGETK